MQKIIWSPFVQKLAFDWIHIHSRRQLGGPVISHSCTISCRPTRPLCLSVCLRYAHNVECNQEKQLNLKQSSTAPTQALTLILKHII